MQLLSFKLSDFEGPLELLLHLISKHKLSILDIEISELLSQYLLFIEQREDKNLEVASEFLEMAARLVYIKTVTLLPKHEMEAEDLKSGLTAELMEYHLCKMAAQKLAEFAVKNKVYVRKPMDVEIDMTYTQTHSTRLLFDAVKLSSGRVIRKLPPSEEVFVPLVKKRVVSVNSRIIYLLNLLYKHESLKFSNIFENSVDRSELVATFLALLQLVKSKRVNINDKTGYITFLKGEKCDEEAIS